MSVSLLKKLRGELAQILAPHFVEFVTEVLRESDQTSEVDSEETGDGDHAVLSSEDGDESDLSEKFDSSDKRKRIPLFGP